MFDAENLTQFDLAFNLEESMSVVVICGYS